MRVNLAAQVYATVLLYCLSQVSECVACALEFMDDCTQQTRVFIQMVDRFLTTFNVKSPKVALLKRKNSITPYKTPNDEHFKAYQNKWEKEAADHKQLPKKEQRKMYLSRETLLGLIHV